MTDTELIDVLEASHAGSGFPFVICRQSTTGRGWRVHSASEREAQFLVDFAAGAHAPTVREAIALYAAKFPEAT